MQGDGRLDVSEKPGQIGAGHGVEVDRGHVPAEILWLDHAIQAARRGVGDRGGELIGSAFQTPVESQDANRAVEATNLSNSRLAEQFCQHTGKATGLGRRLPM